MGGGCWGYRMDDAQIHDGILGDGLNNTVHDQHFGWVTADLEQIPINLVRSLLR